MTSVVEFNHGVASRRGYRGRFTPGIAVFDGCSQLLSDSSLLAADDAMITRMIELACTIGKAGTESVTGLARPLEAFVEVPVNAPLERPVALAAMAMAVEPAGRVAALLSGQAPSASARGSWSGSHSSCAQRSAA